MSHLNMLLIIECVLHIFCCKNGVAKFWSTGVLGFEVKIVETGNGIFQTCIWKTLLFSIKLELFQSLCEQWTPF